MIKKSFLPVVALGMLLASCSGKLGTLSADNFNVQPNPLEAHGGKVSATINGTFPEKYMAKKAVVTVTPELRAADGTSLKGAPATFQGEKVLGNDQTISYRMGGNYTMKSDFAYNDAFRQSELWLNFRALVGNKEVAVPSIKVADGVIATSELYRQALVSTGGVEATDAYQRVRVERQEANIKFLINQALLRKSELKNNSVEEFVSLLQRINNERESYNLKNIEVKAYASPDGGEKFNDKLAKKRQDVSENYVQDLMKKANIQGDVAAEYTAQDWDGFQRLVAASNIQDKDVILRVLSMYQDPQEREEQIKNMSAGFRELADGILPELRRSRLIVNYELVGRSDAQILDQFKADPAKLSVDEILYAATLNGVSDQMKEQIYKTCANVYPNDYRALNNLASLAIANGNVASAKDYLAKAVKADAKAGETQANLALVSLLEGNIPQAEAYMSKANNANGYQQAMGVLNIARGNYAQASQNLKGEASNMTALAQILNKDYQGAINTFKKIGSKGDAMTDYLNAVANARLGNKEAYNTLMKQALQKNPALKAYADSDMEFSTLK